MTALTALSRVTGFVRILVVAAVLGTTFLGNTYQSANMVPNLVFELFAAGVLQAVLIPILVPLLDRGEHREAERVAGSVLGLASAGLAVLAGLGMLAAPWMMRALVAGVPLAATREAQVRLGTFFLWFFLPQMVVYAAGLVATGVLNARDRFALPVFAPVVNNVVVIAAYLLFARLRHGAPPSLDLSLPEKLVLAGGTTLGVVAFCSLPVVAVVAGGFSLRPRLDHRHPEVRRVARKGAWAAVYLAMAQVLLAVVLLLANRQEGGVVAYQVGYTFFLLPHALFAIPVATALFPSLARQGRSAQWAGFARTVEAGVRAVSFLALPITAAFLALATPITRVALFGESRGGGGQVAAVLAWFAPGLVGYGAFLLLTRAFYALDDARTPALVNVGVAMGGGGLMVAAFAASAGPNRVAALAAAHSLAYLGGAVALFVGLRARLPAGQLEVPARALVSCLGAGAVAAVAASGVVEGVARVTGEGRLAGAPVVELLMGGSVVGIAYLATHRLLSGGGPAAALGLPWNQAGPDGRDG